MLSNDMINVSSQLNPAQLVGRIYSVYCKDFVSYSEITYYPKEYLNVLTGPNGTGKSTIVSAIILGLGGDPQLLDRSSSIADYIRSTKTLATIVITIYGKEEFSTEAFTRVIKQSGESRYYVNSKECPKKRFLATIASYNIQVHNLCQFLPQDRVQDFSKMNPQELLLNTMSSVCDIEFIKNFNDLKEMRVKQLHAHSDRDKEVESLQKEQKRLEQLQVTVDQYQERQEILKKLSIYNAKKLWTEVTIGETKLVADKAQLEKATTNCKSLKNTYEINKRAQDEFTKKMSDIRDKTREQIQNLGQASVTRTTLISKWENLKHKINVDKTELQERIQQSLNGESEVEKCMKLINNKQQELEQCNSKKADVLNELEKQKKVINKTRETAMNQYNKRRELEAMLNDDRIPEITALCHRIERLQNIKTQKIEELRVKKPNLINAMNWVAQNKHKYKANIYDPMIFELSIKTEEGAMYLENVVNQRDLYAFLCEDKSDMSDLINELCVKQKLGVNILYCTPGDRCIFTPNIPIAEIMQLGFTSYLIDLVSGPIPIINKLCASYHIHNIPIGRDEISNYTSQVPKSIRVYFGGTKKFVVTTSRYKSATYNTESSIQRKNQLISMDSKQLRALKERHAKAVSEKDQIRNSIGEVDREFERLQIVLREEGEKRRQIEQKLSHFASLENQVKMLLEKVDNIKRTFSSIDSYKAAFGKNVLSDVKNIFQIECQLVKLLESSDKLLTEKKKNLLKSNVLKKEYDSKISKVLESEEQYKVATNTMNKLKTLLQIQEQDIKSKISDIERICDGKLPVHENFPFKEEFSKMSNLDLDQIREATLEFQARLDCMKNVNSQAVADYHQRLADIDKLKKDIENKADEAKNVEAEMTVLYDQWEPKLTQLIETISTKFSSFMESIAYIGEVVLSRKDTRDFDSYGIQIMVQYRKDAKLQTLDKYIQSGGERAVAIAIYSLSLQHVTHVPFRCVDEINQGMDAKNERHIFDLLLREATKEGSAQYLFVTPKLLCDLNYNEHLCVSVVHNSASIKPDVQFALT